MQLSFTSLKDLLLGAAREWSDDKASRLGAAVAYYTIFSIAPLLLITLAIVGFVFGAEAASGGINNQISSLVGPEAAKAIETMVSNAGKQRGTGIFATIFSTALLLIGASGVFVQLKDAMNTIWDVPDKKRQSGIMGFIKAKLLSFGLVFGVGFILLGSLAVSTVLSGVGDFVGGFVAMGPFLQILNFVLSFGVITVMFAMIFKFVPDIKLPWHDVWIGAAVTSLLFTVGKWGLGYYLGRGSVSSAYGAAGSLVALLVWIYYSAQIVFFGAELTQVYSSKYGAWKGRKKNTVKAKEAASRGESSDDAGAASSNVARIEAPLRPRSVSNTETGKPSGIAKAVGTVFGLGIVAKAIVTGLKNHKK